MNYASMQDRYQQLDSKGHKIKEQTGMTNADNKPILHVNPEQSVYSAILFLPAISRLTVGYEWNRSAKLAIFLCVMNAVLQMGVVRVIDVYDHANRKEGIRMLLPGDEVIEKGDNVVTEMNKKFLDSSRDSTADVHRYFLPPNEKEELDSINDIEPLCKRIGDGNGTFTCMPHSVKYVYEWEHLDTNGDGVWTMEEAQYDINKLKKKRGISPKTIFDNVINGLRMQAAYLRRSGSNFTLYLSPDIQKSKAIPKAYFDYWKGDAMMCTVFDDASCEAAAKSGVFESALKPDRHSPQSKGIHDLDSAIQYCQRMLGDGGGCEILLPTDFKRNREQRWGRCGERSVAEGGSYTNPYNPNQNVHILEAEYESVEAYSRATSRLFLFFVALVITLWLLSLVSELRELVKLAEFLYVYPLAAEGDPGGMQNDDKSIKITGIVLTHKIIVAIVIVVRCLVFNVLSQFGTRFLLAETNYFDLVMNSLALTFILTIDGMLFALVEKDVADAVLNCKPLEFETRLPTEGWLGYFLKKECWGLIAVPILSVCIVLHYNYQVREPMLTVLRCACAQEGSKCLDSVPYQAGWWDDYWGKTLPAAIHQIEALKLAANQYTAISMR